MVVLGFTCASSFRAASLCHVGSSSCWPRSADASPPAPSARPQRRPQDQDAAEACTSPRNAHMSRAAQTSSCTIGQRAGMRRPSAPGGREELELGVGRLRWRCILRRRRIILLQPAAVRVTIIAMAQWLVPSLKHVGRMAVGTFLKRDVLALVDQIGRPQRGCCPVAALAPDQADRPRFLSPPLFPLHLLHHLQDPRRCQSWRQDSKRNIKKCNKRNCGRFFYLMLFEQLSYRVR